MKRSSNYLAMAVATVGVFFSSNSLMAQGRQGFDPEQMRQRMMERYQEALGVTSWASCFAVKTLRSDSRACCNSAAAFLRETR